MRTINFDGEDINQCKLALANQNLTPLQSAFLMQYITNIEQENKILKENAGHNDKVVDKVNWENMLLKKENKKQKDNWNKLKEYLYNQIPTDKKVLTKFIKIFEVLNKMQELEGSDSND